MADEERERRERETCAGVVVVCIASQHNVEEGPLPPRRQTEARGPGEKQSRVRCLGKEKQRESLTPVGEREPSQ